MRAAPPDDRLQGQVARDRDRRPAFRSIANSLRTAGRPRSRPEKWPAASSQNSPWKRDHRAGQDQGPPEVRPPPPHVPHGEEQQPAIMTPWMASNTTAEGGPLVDDRRRPVRRRHAPVGVRDAEVHRPAAVGRRLHPDRQVRPLRVRPVPRGRLVREHRRGRGRVRVGPQYPGGVQLGGLQHRVPVDRARRGVRVRVRDRQELDQPAAGVHPDGHHPRLVGRRVRGREAVQSDRLVVHADGTSGRGLCRW